MSTNPRKKQYRGLDGISGFRRLEEARRMGVGRAICRNAPNKRYRGSEGLGDYAD